MSKPGGNVRKDSFSSPSPGKPPATLPQLGGGCFLRFGRDLPPRPRPIFPSAALLACRWLFHRVPAGKGRGWIVTPFLLPKPECAHGQFADPHPLTRRALERASLEGLRPWRPGAQTPFGFLSPDREALRVGRGDRRSPNALSRATLSGHSPALTSAAHLKSVEKGGFGNLGAAISSPPQNGLR